MLARLFRQHPVIGAGLGFASRLCKHSGMPLLGVRQDPCSSLSLPSCFHSNWVPSTCRAVVKVCAQGSPKKKATGSGTSRSHKKAKGGASKSIEGVKGCDSVGDAFMASLTGTPAMQLGTTWVNGHLEGESIDAWNDVDAWGYDSETEELATPEPPRPRLTTTRKRSSKNKAGDGDGPSAQQHPSLATPAAPVAGAAQLQQPSVPTLGAATSTTAPNLARAATSSSAPGEGNSPTTTAAPTAPVYVLWDLDNKYPVTLDYGRVVHKLRRELEQFGKVVEITAYCNYQTLKYVPELWEEALDAGMKHPLAPSQDQLRCPMCGQKFKSEDKLQRHFKQLHEREHRKRFMHKPAVKKYVKSEKYERYQSAVREVLPRTRGFDLEGILRAAGVTVRPVPLGPQKADVALEADARKLLARVQVAPRSSQTPPNAPSSPSPLLSTSLSQSASSAQQQAQPQQELHPQQPQQELLPQQPQQELLPQQPQQELLPQQPQQELLLQQPQQELHPQQPPAAAPVLCLVSDDRGFQPLLKHFTARGWDTVGVSCSALTGAAVWIDWEEVAGF